MYHSDTYYYVNHKILNISPGLLFQSSKSLFGGLTCILGALTIGGSFALQNGLGFTIEQL